jgi:hypothetical protein
MPILAKELNDNNASLLRCMIYGFAMTKKTWWACKAAEAGFNVLYIDGDNNSHVLKNITPEGKAKIRHIKAVDKIDKPVMYDFVIRLLRGDKIVWDDVDNKPLSKLDPQHDCFLIEANKLTPNDIVIIDSWTALCWSLLVKAALERDVAIEDGDRGEQPWELFGDTGRPATWILNRLKTLPCHLIVIAHQDEYVKMKTKKNKSDKPDIDFIRTQASSTSRNHAMLMPKNFSDVFWFKMIGNQFKIDATSDAGRDGGSRTVEPAVYNWGEFDFMHYASKANIKIPVGNEEMPACIFVSAGSQVQNVNGKEAETKEIVTPIQVPVLQSKPKGLLSLLNKGPSQ